MSDSTQEAEGRVENLERERELFGRLLGGQTALELLATELTPGSFHSPAHATIWSTMVQLCRRGARVDAESVIRELGEAVATVGGPEAVRALARPRDAQMGAEPISPSNGEAERAVLGALLVDRGCAELVVLEISAQDFSVPEHALIFEAIARLVSGSGAVDPLLVSAELERNGMLAAAGGHERIRALAAGVKTPTNALQHARLVRDASHLRTARSALEAGLRRIGEAGAEAGEVLARAEQDLFLARRRVVPHEVTGISAALSETFAQILRAQRGVQELPWGYPSLDELTLGLHEGDLVVLASRPGLGKTTFAANVLRNLAVSRPGGPAGHGAVYFSLEAPRRELVASLLCSMAKVDKHRLRGGYLSKQDEEDLLDWGEVLERAPIYIDDTPGLTVPDLRAKARRLKLDGKIECVFVDYLQLLRSGSDDEQRPRHEVVAEISRSLKDLARDLSIPVVALAQLNRDVEDRPDHRPRLRDLRESGSIEVDADVVVFVHRDEYYMTRERAEQEYKVNRAQILVAKNRNGPTGDVELFFAKEFAYFGELIP